jgi:hypothetical protein
VLSFSGSASLAGPVPWRLVGVPDLATTPLLPTLARSRQAGGLAEGIAVEEMNLVYLRTISASGDRAENHVPRNDVCIAGINEYFGSQPGVGRAV